MSNLIQYQSCNDLKIEGLKNIIESVKDRKIDLDHNYLYLLARDNPRLPLEDFVNFLHLSMLNGADPRKKQVFLITREVNYKDDNNRWHKKVVGTTVFAYQFFIARALATGKLNGFDVTTAIEDYADLASGKIKKTIVAIATVYRKDQDHPIIYRARFDEFASKTKAGDLIKSWKEKPYLMIEKCAVANAMRWAFPEELTGMYIEDEIKKDKDDKDVINVEVENKKQIDKSSIKTTANVVEQEKPVKTYKDLFIERVNELTKGDEHKKNYIKKITNYDLNRGAEFDKYWKSGLDILEPVTKEQIEQAVNS